MKDSEVKKLTRASMMLVFAFIIIFLGSRLGSAVFNQIVVGPLVNAVILFTVLLCGLKYGALMAILTPAIASLTGQLLPPMIPFSPFIMVGNVVLAVTFGLLYKYVKGYGAYLGIALGSVLKTAALVLSVKYLVSLFKISIKAPILKKLAVMMSLPQLYSALAGGVIAMILFAVYQRTYRKTESGR